MTAAVEDFMQPLGDTSLEPRPGDVTDRPLSEILTNVDLALVPDTAESVNREDDPEPINDGVGSGSQVVADLLNSGHGFIVRSASAKPRTVWRTTCEVCGGPLPAPGDDPDWLCQYGDEISDRASPTCNCNWCLSYQDYLAGRYRPQGGRPRKRCGSKECDRKAKTEAQKLKRRAKRREQIMAEFANDPPPTRDNTVAALERINELPEQIREGVRKKLTARLAAFDRNMQVTG